MKGGVGERKQDGTCVPERELKKRKGSRIWEDPVTGREISQDRKGASGA